MTVIMQALESWVLHCLITGETSVILHTFVFDIVLFGFTDDSLLLFEMLG